MAFFFYASLRRRFRLQFGLKGLFIATTIAAVWTGIVVRRAREQQTAVRLIREQGGHVYYDFQEQPPRSGRYDHEAESPWPEWLRTSLGEDLFSDVVAVDLDFGPEAAAKRTVPITSPQNAVRHLPALRKLRSFSFGNVELVDETLRIVGQLKNLEKLKALYATNVTDAGIAHLANLHQLKTLLLVGMSVTDESLPILGGFRSLEILALNNSRVSDSGLVHLQNLTNLREIALRQCSGITDRGMPRLSNLPRLEYLDLSGANVTSTGFEHLKQLTRMRRLRMSNNRELGDGALRVIASFNQLEELCLGNTKVTAEGVRRLATLKKLRVLDLSDNSGVTDEAIAHLAGLASLEELNLHNTKASPTAIKHLAQLKRLRILDLSENAAINLDAVPDLTKLAALKQLDLHQTNVKLTQQNADCLSGFVRLNELSLAGTGSDCEAIAKAFPNCNVVGSLADVIWFDDNGYEKLAFELGRQAMYDMEIEDDPFPSPEVLPPQSILKRMIGVTEAAELEPSFGKQRSALLAFVKSLSRSAELGNSRKEQAKELMELARTDASLERLYQAAIKFELADALAEHIEYLDGVRKAWALTDVEQAEYRDATDYLNDCLNDASDQLDMSSEVLSFASEEAITRIWKATQRVASQPEGAAAIKR